MASDEKKTDCVKVHMTERMFIDLNRAAALDDRSGSEFICRIVSLYLYGHLKQCTEANKGPERA